jgi:hypothetical protein
MDWHSTFTGNGMEFIYRTGSPQADNQIHLFFSVFVSQAFTFGAAKVAPA